MFKWPALIFFLLDKGNALRLLICLAVGGLVLWAGDRPQFDMRFQVRGKQKTSESIVLIEVPNQKWDFEYWQALLEKIISQGQPSKVGVTVFLRDRIQTQGLSVFADPRIFWAQALSNLDGHLANNPNIGLVNFAPDGDGSVREIRIFDGQLPHLAWLLAGDRNNAQSVPRQLIINYSGPTGTYRKITARQVMRANFDSQQLQNKIVLIGFSESKSNLIFTPAGYLSRNELVANVVDNIIERKWIRVLHFSIYMAGLIVLLLLSIRVQFYFPRTFALIMLGWIVTALSALSAWIFDSYYIWLPIFAPVVQMAVTYLVFLGYQLTIAERKNWLLEQEQKNLQDIERLKNNFVSLFSHDLKTPIAKIQGTVDRLIVSGENNSWLHDLKNLRSASEELHRYIHSILKVVKVEARDFQVHTEAVDINNVIAKAINQTEPLALQKDITISTILEPLFTIDADADLIEEVVVNLVENAIKYTPASGKITVSSMEIDGQVVVEVEDTGIGIEKSEQQKIWEKFFRGNEGAQTGTGTGLGLYLVKYFIELHGGSVRLKSEPGIGTKIGFSLPIEPEGI